MVLPSLPLSSTNLPDGTSLTVFSFHFSVSCGWSCLSKLHKCLDMEGDGSTSLRKFHWVSYIFSSPLEKKTVRCSSEMLATEMQRIRQCSAMTFFIIKCLLIYPTIAQHQEIQYRDRTRFYLTAIPQPWCSGLCSSIASKYFRQKIIPGVFILWVLLKSMGNSFKTGHLGSYFMTSGGKSVKRMKTWHLCINNDRIKGAKFKFALETCPATYSSPHGKPRSARQDFASKVPMTWFRPALHIYCALLHVSQKRQIACVLFVSRSCASVFAKPQYVTDDNN